MNPISALTNPISDLLQALVMPFRALFVIGLTGSINYLTFNGVWWVKWVALGMGIATVVALARAARAALIIALLYFGGRWLYRRYGEAARRGFEAWATRTQPKAAELLAALRGPQATSQG